MTELLDENPRKTKRNGERDRTANLGVYAVKGGAGRPLGMPNRWTRLKRELADAFEDAKGVQVFRDFLESKKPRERMEVLKIVASLMPREDRLQHEIAQVVLNKVTLAPASSVTCPKCNHHIDLQQAGKSADNVGGESESIMGPSPPLGGGALESSTPPQPKTP